jgi:hypothetical protein
VYEKGFYALPELPVAEVHSVRKYYTCFEKFA